MSQMFIFSHLFLFFLVFCLHKRTTAAALSLLKLDSHSHLGLVFLDVNVMRGNTSLSIIIFLEVQKSERRILTERMIASLPLTIFFVFFCIYIFFLFYLKWSCSTTSRYVLEGIDVGWQERNCGTRVDKKKKSKSNEKFDLKKLHSIASLNFDFYVLFSLYSIGRSLANHQQLLYYYIII